MSYIGRVEQKASDIKRFDVTSSTSATHTLSWAPVNEQSCIVTINGVKQHEDAYSVSGTTLTLTSPLVATDKLEVIGIQDVGQTVVPGTGVIVDSMVSGSAAIAMSKLATDPTNASNISSGTLATARLGSGTADSTTFLRGDQTWAASTSGIVGVSTFTASGTWTKSTREATLGVTIKRLIVEVFGAGGGGGGGNSSGNANGANGGGAGGYSMKFIDVSSISSSTVTIGSAGSGGGAQSDGSAGGNSSWSDGTNTLTCNGGTGGLRSGYNIGNEGGTASGGDINAKGGPGENGFSDTNAHGGKGGTISPAPGGPGVGDYFGTSNLAPRDATGYGHGGAGGNGINGGGTKTGGDGAGGIVIVTEIAG